MRPLVIVLLALVVPVLLVLLLVVRAADVDEEPTRVQTIDVQADPQAFGRWLDSIPTTTTTAKPVIRASRARSAPTERRVVGPVPDSVWDAIARCESGGNWADRRNGYEGGLHWMPDTWRRAGGHRFALHAYDATREQQIEIANSWLARTSWAQWPVCSRKVGVR